MTATIFIMYLWTTVASDQYYTHKDWRPVGEYASKEACEAGAKRLALQAPRYVCVDSGRKQ